MSATFRLDVGLVYTPADVLTVDVGGGALNVDLGATIGSTPYYSDLYASAGGIRKTIEDHLNDVASGFTVAEVNGKYTITRGLAFTLSFPNDSIREFLGFTFSTYVSVTNATSEDTSPGVFIGTRPAYATPGFRWYTRRSAAIKTKGRSHLLSRKDLFDVSVRVQDSELDRWRTVADYLLRGHPFRLYQLEDAASLSGFEPNPVGATNQSGAVDAHLDPSVQTLTDDWLTSPLLQEMAVSFLSIGVA